jgi:hypothetical protein
MRRCRDEVIALLDQSGMHIDALTLFGLVATTAMIVCYALERKSQWFILAFAFSCVLGSAYGFLQGAWPFGLLEAVWALIAARRWQNATSLRAPSNLCQ